MGWIIAAAVLAALLLVYVFLLMPRLAGRPDMTPLRAVQYAHRGLHDNRSDAPENSLKAFRLAVERGFGIELDVQLSKDKVPVVFHDDSLLRVCGVDKKVGELTLAELKTLRLLDSAETIPTFEEFLQLVNGRVPLIVEIKMAWMNAEVCPAAQALLDGYRGVYCVESFNPLALRWYKKNRPRIARGQLATDFRKDKEPGNPLLFFLLGNLLLNRLTRPDFIAYNHKHADKWGFRICRKFYRSFCAAWTIRSEEEWKQAGRWFDVPIFEGYIPQSKA